MILYRLCKNDKIKIGQTTVVLIMRTHFEMPAFLQDKCCWHLSNDRGLWNLSYDKILHININHMVFVFGLFKTCLQKYDYH